MGEVAADALALVEGLPGGPGRARVLVAEGDVAVHEVADRLDARPAEWRGAEQLPGGLGADGRSRSSGCPAGRPGPRPAGPAPRAARPTGRPASAVPGSLTIGVGAKPGRAGRRHQPAAPVAEAVAIGRDRQRRVGHQMVGALQVGDARVVHVQRQDHRRRLRAVVDDVEADADLHCILILSCLQAPQPPAR